MSNIRHTHCNAANGISVLRTVFAIVALIGVSRAGKDHAEAGIAWCIVLIGAISLDGLDGWLARRNGTASATGSFVDIFSDRVTEYAGWLLFVTIYASWRVLIGLIVMRHLIVDGIKVVSAWVGSDMSAGIAATGWRARMIHTKASKISYNALKAIALSCGCLSYTMSPRFIIPTTVVLIFHVLVCWLRGIASMAELPRTISTRHAGARDALFGGFIVQSALTVAVFVMCAAGSNVYGISI